MRPSFCPDGSANAPKKNESAYHRGIHGARSCRNGDRLWQRSDPAIPRSPGPDEAPVTRATRPERRPLPVSIQSSSQHTHARALAATTSWRETSAPTRSARTREARTADARQARADAGSVGTVRPGPDMEHGEQRRAGMAGEQHGSARHRADTGGSAGPRELVGTRQLPVRRVTAADGPTLSALRSRSCDVSHGSRPGRRLAASC